jgi:hypothetical protein
MLCQVSYAGCVRGRRRNQLRRAVHCLWHLGRKPMSKCAHICSKVPEHWQLVTLDVDAMLTRTTAFASDITRPARPALETAHSALSRPTQLKLLQPGCGNDDERLLM